MSEVSERVANFMKLFSMFLVIGSLLYMYGYADAKVDFMNEKSDWLTDLSKVHIFYLGLGFFGLFNLILHTVIHMYKDVRGVDSQSILFRNKKQKEKILVWFNYLLAGINIFTASIIIFIALAKINEVPAQSALMYIPIVGLIILLGMIAGLISAVVRK